ncbi:Pca regulon regulatory protein [Thalassovita gelatinovora]|uniref:Pca regulon regulatory protein n=1 Tax=Thalassovita gelatinovora TaxID=53501 RepID=A0A0P1F5E5_THAGE|nr:IclR family transcriptional regulator [Thalassovita gelatinovora]CUH63071.1 Pca regulon regulatory protein [Thalassovita gelatinovora]SEQ15231.1 transcriptional regulator, IclR family [Thalassovita gelatinovora]
MTNNDHKENRTLSGNLLDDPSDPKFVTALARGLALLRAFRDDEVYLSNQSFATRTGLPKTTVTRLTYTLCKLGYLVQGDPGGEYRLGPGVLTLGHGVLAGMEIKDRAQLELADICRGDNPHVAAALGERFGQSVVYLATHRSPNSVSMVFHLGAQVPLFYSSIGRAILMGLPEDEQDALLDDALRAAEPADHLRLKAGLSRARDDFTRYGFCTSFSDWRKEINGIAVPVRAAQGGSLYAINVGGFAFLNPAETLIDIYAPRLIQAAQTLSQRPQIDA